MSDFNRSGRGRPSAVDAEDLLRQLRQLAKDASVPYVKTSLNKEEYQAMLHSDANKAAREIAKQQSKHRQEYIESLHASGKVLAKWTFEKITKDDFNQMAIGTAFAFCKVDSTEQQEEPGILLIQGAEGTGKTVLSHAIANYMLQTQENPSVAIISFDDLKSACLTTFSAGSAEERARNAEKAARLNYYNEVKLLILDSLCPNREPLTQFDQKILANLLRTRFEKRLSMIIMSTVGLEELPQILGSYCFDSIKMYSTVNAAVLEGASRRQGIKFDNWVLV